MASWTELASAAPGMTRAGRALWEQHGLMYLATVRADLSPGVHPVVPVLAAGSLFVAIGSWSPKWRDLRREPRCVLGVTPLSSGRAPTSCDSPARSCRTIPV